MGLGSPIRIYFCRLRRVLQNILWRYNATERAYKRALMVGLFALQGSNTGQNLTFDGLEHGSTTRRNVRNLVGKTKLVNRSNRVAPAYKRVCTVFLCCLGNVLGNFARSVSKVFKLEYTYGTVPKDGFRLENDFLPDGQRLFRGVHAFPSVGNLVDGYNLTIGVVVELIGCNGSHRQA